MRKVSRKMALGLGLMAMLGALVIAGCGGGGSTTSGSESGSGAGGGGGGEANAMPASSSGSGKTVGTSEVPGLGTVLVDSKGMTLYDFTVDEGTTSNCYGGCETAWPPLTTTGKPTAGGGAMAAALGTTKRKDGTMQVTYKGHPLYTFSGDAGPGEANGSEYEGTWFALDEKGTPVHGKASAGGGGEAESSEESSGGGGYSGY